VELSFLPIDIEAICAERWITDQRRVIAASCRKAGTIRRGQLYERLGHRSASIATVYHTVRLFEEADSRRRFGDGRACHEASPEATTIT
jgi:Fe2+ or Zn2+ uptake regulation protein